MLTCKCGNDLKWQCTDDCEGGLFEGYVIEYQTWFCPECEKEYCVQARANIEESDIEIDEVFENE